MQSRVQHRQLSQMQSQMRQMTRRVLQVSPMLAMTINLKCSTQRLSPVWWWTMFSRTHRCPTHTRTISSHRHNRWSHRLKFRRRSFAAHSNVTRRLPTATTDHLKISRKRLSIDSRLSCRRVQWRCEIIPSGTARRTTLVADMILSLRCRQSVTSARHRHLLIKSLRLTTWWQSCWKSFDSFNWITKIAFKSSLWRSKFLRWADYFTKLQFYRIFTLQEQNPSLPWRCSQWLGDDKSKAENRIKRLSRAANWKMQWALGMQDWVAKASTGDWCKLKVNLCTLKLKYPSPFIILPLCLLVPGSVWMKTFAIWARCAVATASQTRVKMTMPALKTNHSTKARLLMHSRDGSRQEIHLKTRLFHILSAHTMRWAKRTTSIIVRIHHISPINHISSSASIAPREASWKRMSIRDSGVQIVIVGFERDDKQLAASNSGSEATVRCYRWSPRGELCCCFVFVLWLPRRKTLNLVAHKWSESTPPSNRSNFLSLFFTYRFSRHWAAYRASSRIVQR